MRIEERLELGRRLATVIDVADPELGGVSILIPPRKKRGITVFDGNNQPIISMTVECAQESVRNPALRTHPRKEGAYFWSERIVVAMCAQEHGGVIFDWINPRDVGGLLKEALERRQRHEYYPGQSMRDAIARYLIARTFRPA